MQHVFRLLNKVFRPQIGTGFTDENLDTHTAFFKDHVIDKPKSYYRFEHSLEPDVWFDAVQVWEVKAADLSVSPVHQAAVGLVSQPHFEIDQNLA